MGQDFYLCCHHVWLKQNNNNDKLAGKSTKIVELGANFLDHFK